ncbi:MAG: methyltransferase [Nitrosopumilus sp.]|nr:MAG: methyltransferase [Nitrosopumilus sp.]
MSEYTGHKNLEKMSQTNKFNDWIYDEVKQYLNGTILEIGSGLGVFSEKILKDHPNSKITLTEISPTYLSVLKRKFSGKADVKKLDLNENDDYSNIGFNKFDSIIAINVLEHVQLDELALENFRKMLKANGNIIIFVPGHKSLYNIIDKTIGHYRRYSSEELIRKTSKVNLTISKIFQFNFIGMFGWYYNGNLRKKSDLNENSLKLFDKVVPILRIIDKLISNKLGLSLICIMKES